MVHRNLMKRVTFGLVLTLLPCFAAQATAETAQLKSEPFNETLRSAANTGGARVMGLQAIGIDAAAELRVILPKGWKNAPFFCVRTGTSDGLYGTENTYEAPADTTLPVVVPHMAKSIHGERLKTLPPHAYGIRVLLAPCDAAGDDTGIALALWRATEADDVFSLFVNSFSADRLVALPEGGKPVECDLIGTDVSVAFDRVCSVPILVGQNTQTVNLIPFKDGRRGRTETVTFDLK